MPLTVLPFRIFNTRTLGTQVPSPDFLPNGKRPHTVSLALVVDTDGTSGKIGLLNEMEARKK